MDSWLTFGWWLVDVGWWLMMLMIVDDWFRVFFPWAMEIGVSILAQLVDLRSALKPFHRIRVCVILFLLFAAFPSHGGTLSHPPFLDWWDFPVEINIFITKQPYGATHHPQPIILNPSSRWGGAPWLRWNGTARSEHPMFFHWVQDPVPRSEQALVLRW